MDEARLLAVQPFHLFKVQTHAFCLAHLVIGITTEICYEKDLPGRPDRYAIEP